MPYDPEDETGWDALPAISDNEDDRAADSIGPLHTGVDPYIYRLQREDIRTLTLTSQPEKGLSFQIWPSATCLSAYAELQDQQQRGGEECWS